MSIGVKLSTMPPPLICAAAILIGVMGESIRPLVALSATRYLVGGLLIVGSLLAMPGILVKFRRKKTPFDVRKTPSAFITDGLYKLSRNPSYIALIILCLGIGIMLSSLWVLIWLVAAGVIIDRFVIPEEERRLEVAFGNEYRAYKSTVRRWI